MNIETVSRTIQLVLAPVVMMSTCGILVNGMLQRYDAISNRLRAMAGERLELLRSSGDDFADALSNADVFTRERIHQIDYQAPDLLRRHKLLHDAVQIIYWAILLYVSSMFITALAALTSSTPAAGVALALFLGGTAIFLLAMSVSAREMRASHGAVQFEMLRGLHPEEEPDMPGGDGLRGLRTRLRRP